MLQSLQTDPACAHCGLPVPRYRLVTGGVSFCCSGCETVYGLLHELDAAEFYRLRAAPTKSPAKPAHPMDRNFLELDSAAMFDAICEERDGVFSARFSVDGVHCAACVWLLEQLPRFLPGVHSARLSLAEHELRVSFNPKTAPLSAIAQLISRLGYSVRALTPGEKSAPAHRRALLRLGITGFCAANVMVIAVSLYQGGLTGIEPQYEHFFRWMSLLLTLPVLIIGGGSFFRRALGSLRQGALHLDLPISIGVLIAFFASALNTFRGAGDVYFDSVSVLIFLLLAARYIQEQALVRSSRSVARGVPFVGDVAHRVSEGTERDVPIRTIMPGDEIVLRVGERSPVDGVVQSGHSELDVSLLTGESRPVRVEKSGRVFAGTMNLGSPLVLRAERTGKFTRLAEVLAAAESEEASRAPITEMVQRIIGPFLLLILGGAALTLVLWLPSGVEPAVQNVVAFLVVMCPCALGLATPIAFSHALGCAWRRGIIIRGEDVLQRISGVKRVMLDKTGTITVPQPRVVECWTHGDSRHDASHLFGVVAALEERAIHHPIRSALLQYVRDDARRVVLEHIATSAGFGVRGVSADGAEWRLGSERFLRATGVNLDGASVSRAQSWEAQGISPVFLTEEGNLVGMFGVLSPLRENAREVLSWLVRRFPVILLSGDRRRIVDETLVALDVPQIQAYAELNPEEKAERVDSESMMVGDGVNDAIALRRARVGVALQGDLTAAMPLADVFLLHGDLSDLRRVILGAERTISTIRRNLAFSLVYNIGGGLAALLGYITPLAAALLMPVSSLTVILSSVMRDPFRDGHR